MPSNLHTHDLVLHLKEVRAKNGVTLQEISDKLDERGCHIGFTSIKKVFSEGSENLGFRYYDTLDPIEKLFRELYSDTDDVESETLKAALVVKDELIERRERELEECTRKLEECREDSRNRIEYLKHQIELKDQRIDKLMSRVDVLLAQLQKLLEKIS